ncbi:hypothetical protein [Arabidopsis thaliana]|nr:hypothetical protein [Arabidopsis thaliana]CAB78998.1 hypothetical protein [Arabidopsis thaliana]
MKKLRRAISRSDVIVSVFCKPQHVDVDDAVLYSEEESLSSSLYTSEFGRQNKDDSFLGDLFQNAVPLTPSNGQLVGFGRAYSDYGLTASIHDLMVRSSFIKNCYNRLLTSRDIYDIAALCFEDESHLNGIFPAYTRRQGYHRNRRDKEVQCPNSDAKLLRHVPCKTHQKTEEKREVVAGYVDGSETRELFAMPDLIEIIKIPCKLEINNIP